MDVITLLLYMFFGFVLLMIILVGIAFLRALFGIHSASGPQSNSKITEHVPASDEEDQIAKDIQEDSEGDGLMLFDDPMFPPESDDEDDDS